MLGAGIRWAELTGLRPGVRCRVVLPVGRRGPATGLVRVVADVPVDLVVVDRLAVVYPRDGAVLTFAGAVATAAELFERLWAAGRTPGDYGLSARDRAVLGLLSDGCADESMAVQLGISVRTVRRRVSDLMARLGARSRFQAGARAACRGWLDSAELTGAVRAHAG